MRRLRVRRDSGIALGPVLFIIAILGILATAIAAGSGSFTSNAGTEAARVNASALIQIGTLLKSGFDRMIGMGVDFDAINIDPAATSNANDLFAPAGGSINIPSVTLANDPATDVWHYPFADLPQMGSGSTERVAFLKVTLAVCDQANIKTNAITTTASNSILANDIGDVTATTLVGATNWPPVLAGKDSGCLKNTNGATPGYFYYQVLGIR